MPTVQSTFIPKQCCPKTSYLLDAMIAESTITVARKYLREYLPTIPPGSIIHDNGSGTGAVTRAIWDVYPQLFQNEEPRETKRETRILATDLNRLFLDDLPAHLSKSISVSGITDKKETGKEEIIQLLVQDAHDLNQIASESITHSFTNFVIFGLQDPVLAAREIHRTLAPGGVAVITTWATLPHSLALDRTRAVLYDEWESSIDHERISKQHIPEKWFHSQTTVDVLWEAGFTGRVQVVKIRSGMVHESLESWTQMAWSWMGMPAGGWTERNEREWDADRALFGQECLKSGFVIDQAGGRVRVVMEANVVLAWK